MLGLVALLAASLRPVIAQDGTRDADDGGVTVHVVQDGETLEDIARQYGSSVASIREANSMVGYGEIAVGQRLVVPIAAAPRSALAEQTIVTGYADTLYAVAAREGVSLDRLAALNHVANPFDLNAGQSLRVPGLAWSQPAALLRFGAGDTLIRIALSTGSSLHALMAANDLSNAYSLAEGRILVVPGESNVELPTGAQPGDPWRSIVFHPLPLEQGRAGGLEVETVGPGTLSVVFLGREWDVAVEGSVYRVLLAVDRWTSPGLYPLTLTFDDETGAAWSLTRQVLVADGGYPSERIRLPEEVAAVLTQPEAVQAEFLYIQQKMTGFTSQKRWSGRFLLPSPGVLTSGYGALRSYNDGGFNSYHSGADLAGPTGTPIYAPADGVVVDTGLLDVRGYTTIIDHGRGVYTGYWHQSAIMVNPGDEVVAGQQIGLIGSTGLSTAAHLHWEMWVGGVRIDPMQWVREAFP